MAIQLGYQRGTVLTPGQRRVRLHLMAWGLGLLVGAAGFALLELFFLFALGMIVVMRGDGIVLTILFAINCFFTVLSLIFWRIGRNIWSGRRAVEKESRWELEKAARAFTILLVLGGLFVLLGAYIASSPTFVLLGRTPSGSAPMVRDAGWVVRSIVVGIPIAIVGLMLWSRWELQQTIRQLW